MNIEEVRRDNELNIEAAIAGVTMTEVLVELRELLGKDEDITADTVKRIIHLPYNTYGKQARCLAPFYAVGVFDTETIRHTINNACYNDNAPACNSQEDYIKLTEEIVVGFPSLRRELLTEHSTHEWEGFENEPQAKLLLDVASAKGCAITPTDFVPPQVLKFDEAIGYMYPGSGYNTRQAIYRAACVFLHPVDRNDYIVKFSKLLKGDFGV